MRVLHYLFFAGGGIGRYAHEQATQLSLLDRTKFELVCMPEYEHRESASYPTAPILFSISSPTPLIRRLRFLVAQWINPIRLIRHAISTKADVIHLQNVNHLTYALWRRRLCRSGVKLAVTAHDVRRSKSIVSRRWETHWLKQVYRDADALFVHSEHQVDDLIEFAQVPRNRIQIVPFGSLPYPTPNADKQELREKWEIESERWVGLFFGNLRDDKNLENLLHAMKQLEDRPLLLIAGRSGGKGNHSTQYYQDLIERLDLSDEVRLLDRFITDEEVGELFSLSDFVPLTYRRSFTSQSAVLGVAAHFGCPLLVTPAPTLLQTTSEFDVGVVCSGDAPTALSDGLRTLLTRLERADPFDFHAFCEANSWAENARISVNVYERILNTSPPSVVANHARV